MMKRTTGKGKLAENVSYICRVDEIFKFNAKLVTVGCQFIKSDLSNGLYFLLSTIIWLLSVGFS